MEESSIVRSNYKFVCLLSLKIPGIRACYIGRVPVPHPHPQQSSPYRIGHALRWACTILLKSFYDQTLVAPAFCLVEEKDSGFWTMLSLCVSHLENDRIGE